MDRGRFLSLWQRCGGSASSAERIFHELKEGYGEPHRRYHTGRHIEHCLVQIDLARNAMDHADAIEIALWFHDLVYDPKASDNEHQSAQRLKQVAHGQLKPELTDQVARLIMATVHDHPPQETDAKYVVDIDLSSFGLPTEEFAQDSINVRDEFPHLADSVFAAKNAGFLQSLLDRPSIYCTDFFRTLYETAARRNITGQIAKLRALADYSAPRP